MERTGGNHRKTRVKPRTETVEPLTTSLPNLDNGSTAFGNELGEHAEAGGTMQILSTGFTRE